MPQETFSFEEWGKALSKMILATEGRIASYKKLVEAAYKAGDREMVEMIKGFRQDEEKWVKRLRWEKTCLNAGVWEWCLENPEGGKLQG